MSQTPKVKAFLEEIEAVCRKHELVLAVSGYDGLQVWPNKHEGDFEEDIKRIKSADDMTGE